VRAAAVIESFDGRPVGANGNGERGVNPQSREQSQGRTEVSHQKSFDVLAEAMPTTSTLSLTMAPSTHCGAETWRSLSAAIDVHKAQVSAFQHVVIPLIESKLLDRMLVYTAVTRAVRSAMRVGDESHRVPAAQIQVEPP
jgi:UvrD-like helicase C-terminal domain